MKEEIITERTRNDIFVNVIENMEKLKIHFSDENKQSLSNLQNLKDGFSLWIEDVKATLKTGFSNKVKEIPIQNFNPHSNTTGISGVFCDFIKFKSRKSKRRKK